MGDYFTMERNIRANPNMTTEQKDKLLEKLKSAENTYSEAFYDLSEKTKRR
jgi:phage terminase large subunit-like protein